LVWRYHSKFEVGLVLADGRTDMTRIIGGFRIIFELSSAYWRNFPHFMEPEGLLPCSQDPATRPSWSSWIQSTSQLPIYSL